MKGYEQRISEASLKTMNWYEVWADEGHPVPYILVLQPKGQTFQIFDPAVSSKKVFEALDYESARNWLLEDEYVLVGRKEIDEE